MEEDGTREFEFRRQKEAVKTLLAQGDAYFVSGRLIEASASFAKTSEQLRTCDARLPPEIRWKRAATTESKRRVEMVMALLPKEKQHDAMAAMQLRRQKEAEAIGGDGSEDPEQLIQNSRRKLRHNCDRIRRQLALAQEIRTRTECTVVSSQPSLTTTEGELDQMSDKVVRPVTPKPVPLLSKVGSMVESLKDDMLSRNLRNNVVNEEWKFDGVRGVYLVEKGVPETFNTRPLTPREDEEVEEVRETDPVGKTAAERMASLIGEPFIPLKNHNQLLGIQENQSDDCNQETIDEDRVIELVNDREEGEKKEEGHLDSLEKALLLDSMRFLPTKNAVPRSTDIYATPTLDEMKIEQKFMDTRLEYALRKAPMIGRHHRLKLGLRGNNPT